METRSKKRYRFLSPCSSSNRNNKTLVAEMEKQRDPIEDEKSGRMRRLRDTWDKNRDVFTRILDEGCLDEWFSGDTGWESFAKASHVELGLKTPIPEETIQSCNDYAAELRELLKECEKLDNYKLKSKATHIGDGFKKMLINIFDRKPLKLKKNGGASTSSGSISTSTSRNSYARKSSSGTMPGSISTSTDPSVHMPCTVVLPSSRSDDWDEWEEKLTPILTDLYGKGFLAAHELNLISDHFRKSETRVGISIFLRLQSDEKRMKYIRETVETEIRK